MGQWTILIESFYSYSYIYTVYMNYYINALFIVLLCSSFINIIIMNSYSFDIGLYMVHSIYKLFISAQFTQMRPFKKS